MKIDRAYFLAAAAFAVVGGDYCDGGGDDFPTESPGVVVATAVAFDHRCSHCRTAAAAAVAATTRNCAHCGTVARYASCCTDAGAAGAAAYSPSRASSQATAGLFPSCRAAAPWKNDPYMSYTRRHHHRARDRTHLHI